MKSQYYAVNHFYIKCNDYVLKVKVEIKKEMDDLMSKHYGFDHEVTFDVDRLQTQVDILSNLR